MPNAEQARQLKSLTTTYWSFKQVTLLACSDEEVCSESVHRAVDALQSIPALHCVTVSGLGSSSMGWAAVLQGLAGFAAPPLVVRYLKVVLADQPGSVCCDVVGKQAATAAKEERDVGFHLLQTIWHGAIAAPCWLQVLHQAACAPWQCMSCALEVRACWWADTNLGYSGVSRS